MTVDSSRFATLETLFERVTALTGDARKQALADAARTHPDLYAELVALIAAHEDLSHTDDSGDSTPEVVTIGSRVGGYCIAERLGQGGMGEVFRAERVDGVFDAEVAIKVTRATLGRGDLRRRFHTERQILASLRHPHIVTLLDGGAADTGQAYLIMEYVRGVPVTEYCRTARLSLHARLEIFRGVCSAVQHAHQHGVVHRDLKPANVLVGADGIPKVLDFGIAKLLDDPATPGTLAAAPGPLTPNYASPEQLRGLPVTTAADIYALGVMLYEIVSGARPYETEGEPFDRVLQIVLDDEPRRASVAAAGQPLPYSTGALRGDLDAIVQKAMHKDPAERYQSAAELTADLSRVAAGDPVLARAPTTMYMLRRLAAKHRTVVAVTGLALVGIVTAFGLALWQRQVALAAQARAEARFRDVRQLANVLIFKIESAVAALPGSTPVRRTIVDEAIGYLERLEAESAGDVPLRLELAAAYRRLGGILGAPNQPNLGDRAGALRLHERSRAIVEPLAVSGAHPDVIGALVDGHAALATILAQQGDQPQATALARRALASAERAGAERSDDFRTATQVAQASFMLATMLPPADALPVWETTLARYERLLITQPDNAQMQRNVALTCKYMGTLFENRNDLAQAQKMYARALELDEKRLAARPGDPRSQFDAAITFSSYGGVAFKLGDADTASRMFERSLGLRRALSDADPKNMQARHRLGFLLARLAWVNRTQRPSRAREYARDAIVVLEDVVAATGDRRARFDLGFAWVQAAVAAEHADDRMGACAAFRRARQQFSGEMPELTDNDPKAVEEANAGLARCSPAEGTRDPRGRKSTPR
jgi:non-specific serine/threonine protein kinase/serine/threonine-protein kinase